MKVNFSETSNCELIGNKLYSTPDNTLAAEIYLKNYKYIELHYITDKDKECYRTLKLYKNKPAAQDVVNNPLFNNNGLHICQNCNRPILKINEDEIFSYALYVICQCDTVYDRRRIRDEDRVDIDIQDI